MIVTLVNRAWNAIVRTNQNAVAARQLHAMSDAQLADIGVERGQIDLLVFGEAPAQPEARKVRRPAFTLRDTLTA